MADVSKITAGMAAVNKTSEYTEKVEANDMNLLSTAFTTLLNLGAESAGDKDQRKYIRIGNFTAISFFLCGLVYVVFGIFWESWYWFQCSVALCITCLMVLVMSGWGKTDLARTVMVVGLNVLLFAMAVLSGPYTNIDNFFIITAIIPFLVFDLKKKRQIALGVAVPVLLATCCAAFSSGFSAYNLQPGQQLILSHVSLVGQVILALCIMYQFVLYVRKAETDLETSRQQMGLQTVELKRSNADLEQFAYIISHDLRAPVRNISSFMNLLAAKHGPNMAPDAREFVEYARSGAKRMERLIEDVLSYCRIGTNLPKPTPLNLNEVVNTVRFELRERLTTINGAITVNGELPTVNNVHSSLMYHIFQNLITNGLKFNKSERPEISIQCTNSLNYYTFSVHDNGIGISKEFQATVFQMFKRLHTESEYDGTGIGLAIVKKIVSYYNGEIWFESEPGKGTTFNFTIRKF